MLTWLFRAPLNFGLGLHGQVQQVGRRLGQDLEDAENWRDLSRPRWLISTLGLWSPNNDWDKARKLTRWSASWIASASAFFEVTSYQGYSSSASPSRLRGQQRNRNESTINLITTDFRMSVNTFLGITIVIFSSQGFTLECVVAAVIDHKGLRCFRRFVQTPSPKVCRHVRTENSLFRIYRRKADVSIEVVSRRQP